MKTEKQIEEQIKKLEMQRDYLHSFLSTCYKGSDAKEKVERELIPLKREINALRWIIEPESLPF